MTPAAESGGPTPCTQLTPKATPLSPTILTPAVGTTSSTILSTKTTSSGASLSTHHTGSIFDKPDAFPPEPLLPDTSVPVLGSFIAAANGPHFDYLFTMPWRSWDEVPDPEGAPEWLRTRGVFVEIFAGTAHLTQAMRTAGIVCLPPIEKDLTADWFDPTDAFKVEGKLMRWVKSGAVHFLHCGTECKTFSAARQYDGRGPPPIRCPSTFEPLRTCTPKQRDDVLLGSRMAQMTFTPCLEMIQANRKFTIENPLTSMLLNMPAVKAMRDDTKTGTFFAEFSMCLYGSTSLKPTAILTNWEGASYLCQVCKESGKEKPHMQFPLKGPFKHPVTKQDTYYTKIAQEYPAQLVQDWSFGCGTHYFWRDNSGFSIGHLPIWYSVPENLRHES